MTVTHHKRICPGIFDFNVVRQGRKLFIEAKLISASGITYDLKLVDHLKLSDAKVTNVVDFFQNLDTEKIGFVEIFGESTQCGNTEHKSWRMHIHLKDKSIPMIHCSKIHGIPKN